MEVGGGIKQSFIHLLSSFCTEKIVFQDQVLVTATLSFQIDNEPKRQFDIEEVFSRPTNLVEKKKRPPGIDQSTSRENDLDHNRPHSPSEQDASDPDELEVKENKDITNEEASDVKLKRSVLKRGRTRGNTKIHCPFCSTDTYDELTIKDHLRFSHMIINYKSCPFCKEESEFDSVLKLLEHINANHTSDKTNINKRKSRSPKKVNKKSRVNKSQSKKKTKDSKKNADENTKEDDNFDNILYIDVCPDYHDNDKRTNKTSPKKVKVKEKRWRVEVKCVECDRVYQSRGALRRHVENTHKSNEFVCDLCGKQFIGKDSLMHHKRGVHQNLKPYKCTKPGCDASFNFNHSLRLHKLKHDGLRPHECKDCGKTYLTAYHLKVHIQAAHSAIKQFSCSTCGKLFSYSTSLKMHEATHKQQQTRIHCDQCDKTFVNTQALKYHIMSKHTEPGYHPCKECKKVFKSELLLRTHVKRHSKDGSRFMCDVCGRQFMYKSALELHKAIHKDEKAYECKICKKTFKTYPTLYSHMYVHKEDSPFQCGQCGKAFKTKERCKAHEKRHSGLKPFECEICHHCFPDKGGLSKHTRTVHTKVKRFTCDICGKSTTRADNLRVHMKTHLKDDSNKQANVVKEAKSEVTSVVPLTVYGVVGSIMKKNKNNKKNNALKEDNSDASINSSQKSSAYEQSNHHDMAIKHNFLNLPTIDPSQLAPNVDNSNLPLNLQQHPSTTSSGYNLSHITNVGSTVSTGIIPSVVDSDDVPISQATQPVAATTIVLPAQSVSSLQPSPYVYAHWPYMYTTGIQPQQQNGANEYFQS